MRGAAAVAVLTALLAIALIVPFWSAENPLALDMAGHFFSAWYVREHTFPALAWWSPFHYAGMPLLQFYPPLYTLLTVLLAQALPLQAAFMAVVSSAVLLTPWSFYYCGRKLGLDELRAAAAMLGMVAVMFFSENAAGGDFISTFAIGLVPNAIALPLLFFYIGALAESFRTKRFAKPALLMAAVVLSHVFTAMAAGVASAAFMAVKGEDSDRKWYAKHVLLTFLLVAWWLVPLLATRNYTGTFYVSPKWATGLMPFYAVAIGAVALALWKAWQTALRPVAAALLALVLVTAGGYALHVPFHFYRFNVFILLLVPLVAAGAVRKRMSVAILAVVFAAVLLTSLGKVSVGTLPYEIDFGKVEGRIAVLPPWSETFADQSAHTLSSMIPVKTGSWAVQGLLYESSATAPYLGDVLTWIAPEAFYPWWFHFPRYGIEAERTEERVQQLFGLFMINYVIADERLNVSKQLVRKDAARLGSFSYSLYRVGNASLAVVLKKQPQKVEGDWEQAVRQWLFAGDVEHVLVQGNVPEGKGSGNDTVVVKDAGSRGDRIVLSVGAPQPVPVLVKMSYFPNWKAYVNGKEVGVYPASPSFMLVYGRGEIVLRYERQWWDYFGVFLSVAGVVWMLFFLAAAKAKRK